MGQVGIASGALLKDHGHSMSGDGAQLNPDTALNPKIAPDFGDGSDGDVNIVGNVLLTRSMSYNLLVVTNASILYSMGFKVRAKIKLTVDAGGFISAAGQPGVPGAAGSGGPGGLVNYTGTRLPEASLPTPGAAGGDGGAAGTDFSVSNIPPDPILINVQALHEGRLWSGAGGAGGGAIGNVPVAGGVPVRVLAGAKGGRGADAIYLGPGNRFFGGGGGGAGGGKIDIAAQEIDNNGTITADGGIGGDGEGDAIAQAGGGGGGGGGAIDIKYKTVSGGGLGTRTVAGGLGGGSFGGVADGNPGTVGYSYAMKIAA